MVRRHWHMNDNLFVYRFFDKDDRLLYVGLTDDIHRREKEHKRSKPWFGQVARTVLMGHYPLAEAQRIERRAIENEQPRFNRKPGKTARQEARQRWWSS